MEKEIKKMLETEELSDIDSYFDLVNNLQSQALISLLIKKKIISNNELVKEMESTMKEINKAVRNTMKDKELIKILDKKSKPLYVG